MFTFFTSGKLKANKGRISNYVQVSKLMVKYYNDLLWKHSEGGRDTYWDLVRPK